MTDEPDRHELERISTGIRGLDTILGGGILAGSVQLVLGRPGSGKTVFANQLAFHRAGQGQTAAYVTLLAESHARMMSHLRPFEFFNPYLVSRQVLYMSGYSVLDQGGLDGLLDLLTKTIREHNASLLVLDGLGTAKEFAPTTNSFKRFLLRLATSASLTGCTTLLLATIDRLSEAQPENGTVDGIIVLNKRTCEGRVMREVVIEKMRATKYALGTHAIEISSRGLHIFPRIESLSTHVATPMANEGRIEFGVEGLDAMLEGGVAQGTTTALLGSAGTGKTLLGMSFLVQGAKHNQAAIYFGFREPPTRVEQAARMIGIDTQSAIARDLLTMHWIPTTERTIDDVAWELLDTVDERKATRVLIDGLRGFAAMATFHDRLERFYAALVTMLAQRGVTTIVAETLPEGTFTFDTQLQHLSPVFLDNVLVVRRFEKTGAMRRSIIALKTQAGAHDLSPQRFHISYKGLSVDRPRFGKSGKDKP